MRAIRAASRARLSLAARLRAKRARVCRSFASGDGRQSERCSVELTWLFTSSQPIRERTRGHRLSSTFELVESSRMDALKKCTKCGENKAATRRFFGSTPAGGLRGACRACMATHSADYHRRNPGMQAARNQARQQRGGHIHIDAALRQRLFERQRGICMCCGLKLVSMHQAEVDHAIPVGRGGTHDEANLFLAHDQCNREKHAKTLDEHWAWRKKVGLKGTRPKY